MRKITVAKNHKLTPSSCTGKLSQRNFLLRSSAFFVNKVLRLFCTAVEKCSIISACISWEITGFVRIA